MATLQAPLMCGICRKFINPGMDTRKVRVSEKDMEGQPFPNPKTPGLYQCCEECETLYRGIIAKRLEKRVEDMTQGDSL